MKKLIPLLLSCFLHAGMVEEAVTRPIAFSVVREDSLQDIEVIHRYFSEEKVSMLMVASGGCTAASLVADIPFQDLTLVDPNLAQLQLSKLKLQFLTLSPRKRLEILGYLPMKAEERKSILCGFMHALDIERSALGDLDLIGERGLDFTGRYERIFEEIRALLDDHQIEELFAQTDLEKQTELVDPETPLGKAIDKAFDAVMSQENLTHIFGEKATANRVQDFSRHFLERTRTFLKLQLASSSPWMAHLFLGRFYGEEMFPWLKCKMVHCFPKISYFHGTMNEALKESKPESYHVIHLSNILDWLSPEEARTTLALSFKALKPGGCVIIRQLNSNLDIPILGTEFEWSDLKEPVDRSFFYRNAYLGFKPRQSLAPQVQKLADVVLQERPILEGAFFKALPTMPLEIFRKTQQQFYFAVDYFSRPMSALVARLPFHKDRIDIIHNIVEEHGDFSVNRYHSNTFRQFLCTIDAEVPSQISAHVDAFNFTLMGVCANEDPILAVACNGIIEYAFADISAYLGRTVVDREWVSEEDLVHYNLHAHIDKRHAEELFKIIEPYAEDPKAREMVIAGLRLGAYIFNRLYEDLYTEAL